MCLRMKWVTFKQRPTITGTLARHALVSGDRGPQLVLQAGRLERGRGQAVVAWERTEVCRAVCGGWHRPAAQMTLTAHTQTPNTPFQNVAASELSSSSL